MKIKVLLGVDSSHWEFLNNIIRNTMITEATNSIPYLPWGKNFWIARNITPAQARDIKPMTAKTTPLVL